MKSRSLEKVWLVQPAAVATPSPLTEKIRLHVGQGWEEDRFYQQVPLALLIAARWFPGARLHIETLDGPFSPAPGMDLVLLTAVTSQANRAYEIARQSRECGVPVGLGGVHASVLPAEAATHVDFVFRGELEGVLPEFLEDFQAGEVGKTYGPRDPGTLWHVMPAYELLSGRDLRVVPVQTSRGCPRDCQFCSVPTIFGKSLRRKPAEQIRRELLAIQRVFPDSSRVRLLLVDDNLFLDPPGVRQWLPQLQQTGFSWSTYSDLTLARDEALLHEAKAAGLTHVFCGLESVSPRVLEGISRFKKALLPDYWQAIQTIQQAGVGLFASFILGFDEDDLQSVPAIKEFLDRQPLFRAAFGLLVPYPGTPVHDKFVAEGRLLTRIWDHYHEWDLVFRHPHLRREQLVAMVLELYDHFYSRESGLARIRYFKEIQRSRS